MENIGKKENEEYKTKKDQHCAWDKNGTLGGVT